LFAYEYVDISIEVGGKDSAGEVEWFVGIVDDTAVCKEG
jgi:hypothetical protein